MSDPIDDAEPDNGETPKKGSDYDVGYGKPPKHGQFKKGNKLGGRKKGSMGMKTMVNKAFNAKRAVRQGGKVKRVTKGFLSMTQLANKASDGDLKAIEKALPLLERYGPQEDVGSPKLKDIKPDIETLRLYLAWHDLIDPPEGTEDSGFDDEDNEGEADLPDGDNDDEEDDDEGNAGHG